MNLNVLYVITISYFLNMHMYVDYERLVDECENSAATKPKGHYITNACVRKDRKMDFYIFC